MENCFRRLRKRTTLLHYSWVGCEGHINLLAIPPSTDMLDSNDQACMKLPAWRSSKVVMEES